MDDAVVADEVVVGEVKDGEAWRRKEKKCLFFLDSNFYPK